MVWVIVLAVLIGLWGVVAVGGLILYAVRYSGASGPSPRPQVDRLDGRPIVHEWHGFPAT